MNRYTKGFSLIEILVVIAMISLGFLALAKMHVLSLRYVTASHFQLIALQQVENLAERIQGLSSPHQMAVVIAEWNSENSEQLPQGRGEVTHNNSQYTIQLYWYEPNLLGQIRGGSKIQSIKLVV